MAVTQDQIRRQKKCYRCGKRYRGKGLWNIETRGNELVGILCPSCQTPEESLEAEVHQATLHYVTTDDGRLINLPKV